MELVRQVGYAQAYSFKYSPRPGTPAAQSQDQIPETVKADRLERLQALLKEHLPLILDFDLAGPSRSQQGAPFDRDARLSEAGVRRRQVARSRQLVAGDVVLRDQHGAFAQFLGERDGDRPADRVEEHDCAVVGQRGGPATDVGDIEDHRIVDRLVRPWTRRRPRRLDDRRVVADLPGAGLQADLDGEPLVFGTPPVDQRAVRSGDRSEPADPVRLLDHRDAVIDLRCGTEVDLVAKHTSSLVERVGVLDAAADGLAVAHLRLADVGLHLELALQPVDDDVQVELTHPADDGLARLFVGVGPEARVFLL